MRYAQVVVGPAGSGKSTYCSTIAKTCSDPKREFHIVNLDPAAEDLAYEPLVDIRELIHVEDVVEEEQLGPNGALVYCMEYLLKSFDWLEEAIGIGEEDYFLFDCPGQIELYTHMTVMKDIFHLLVRKLNFQVCAVFIIDSEIVVDIPRFLSVTMTAVATWMNLELPSINILTKIDILSKQALSLVRRFLEPDVLLLLEEHDNEYPIWNRKHKKLSTTIANLIEENSMVRLWPINITDEESVGDILSIINNLLEVGENHDVKMRDFESDFGLDS